MSLHARVVLELKRFYLDVGLDVETGETLALLGVNGSGKTTVLNALAGLVGLDDGFVSIDNDTVDDGRRIFVPPEQRSVGMVFQDYALFPHLSVADNIAFGLRTRRGAEIPILHSGGRPTVDALVAEHAERFDLSKLLSRFPHQLSGGQAQRVALARAMITEPHLLLLDEPMAALDAGARGDARRDLDHLLGAYDGTRVLVTHDPTDVYALADRVAIIEAGRVVQAGTVAEVTARPRSQFVADLVGTNLVDGDLINGELRTDTGAALPVIADFEGPAWASIRPQSITLSADHSSSSARITIEGVITEMVTIADRVRVSFDGPVPLTAEITPASASSLGLAIGESTIAHIKTTDVAVYPA